MRNLLCAAPLPIVGRAASMLLLPFKSSRKSFLNEGLSNSVPMSRNGKIGGTFFVDQSQRRLQ